MVHFLMELAKLPAGFFSADAADFSLLNKASPSDPPRSGGRARRARKKSHFFRPVVEGMEERIVPDAISWVGGVDVNKPSDWGTAVNWQPQRAPTSIDDVTITAVASNTSPIISAAGAKAQSVSITN